MYSQIPDQCFLNCFTKIFLLHSLCLFLSFPIAPCPHPPPTLSEKKKKVKPPRILITKDGKALNVNDPKYVRPKRYSAEAERMVVVVRMVFVYRFALWRTDLTALNRPDEPNKNVVVCIFENRASRMFSST